MKARLIALLAALAAAAAWAATPQIIGQDPCARAEDNAACTVPGSTTPGQCTWLTSLEREKLRIRTDTDCRMQGRHAGSCHTCVSKEQLATISTRPAAKDPKEAKK